MSELVLVTGGSGFIGAHTIVQLIKSGARVRATLRTPSREGEVRDMLAAGGVQAGESLSFVKADLLSDDGWSDAAKGCDYVLHVASPFPAALPKDENDLIKPAREGTLRALKAAKSAGVKRAVVTSSFAAIAWGNEGTLADPLTEESWTNVNAPGASAYIKSKTIAERAAWEFANKEGLELSVVNPVAVLGPLLGKDFSTSIELVKILLEGKMAGCPNMGFPLVDVRDVASLHLLAMRHPAAAGQRFIASNEGFCWFLDIAYALKERLGPLARKVPTRTLPNWLVRLFALLDPRVAQIAPELGRVRPATAAKAVKLLGWTRISNDDAIEATARSLIEQGIVQV
jgi:nucleoside-diphosphate-sugar epimerase